MKTQNVVVTGIGFFEHFPEESKCFLCNTNVDKPCTLIGVDHTAKGGCEEALPVHIQCMADHKVWRINRESGVMYAKDMRAPE